MDIKDVFPNAAIIESLEHAELLDSLQPATAFEVDEIQGIEGCRTSHNALLHDFRAAEQQLFAAMGLSPAVLQSKGETVANVCSWHYSPRRLPDGREIPMLYKVVAGLRKGRLADTQVDGNYCAVKVTACIVQPHRGSITDKNARALTGRFAGHVVHPAQSQSASLPAGFVQLPARNKLEQVIIAEICDDARQRAVMPYVEGFIGSAASVGSSAEIGDALDRNNFRGDTVRDLFTTRSEVTEQAVQVLYDGLKASSIETLRTWWTKSSRQGNLRDLMSVTGGIARYSWLADNLATIRKDIMELTRREVIFGYADRHALALQPVRAKIVELEELALSLSQAMPATDWVERGEA